MTKNKRNLKSKKKTKSGKKYCSPGNKNKKSYTCFNKKSLRKMAKEWNNSNDDKIKINSNDRQIWENIEDKMKQKCNNEWCWINKISSNLDHKEIFRPEKPKLWNKKEREWLDSINISDVMKQYEEKHKDFIFIGPVPIDFDLKNHFGNCVVDELCKTNLDTLIKKGKTQIGIIFNLDKHDESGSHWVALYCNTKKSRINYFDSYGMEPEDEIKTLMNRFHDKLEARNKKCTIEINKKRHQYKGTECGVYCLYFIITMLSNKINFSKFCNNHMPDDKIFKQRSMLFIS